MPKKATEVKHLRLLATTVNSFISTVLDSVIGAIDEINANKAAKAIETTITIPVSAWQSAADEYGFYAYRATISVPKATSSQCVLASIEPSYITTARKAGVCEICENSTRQVSFFAARKPTGSIMVDLRLFETE